MCFYISESETLLLAHSPGLNFGVFEYHTPKNFLKWNIQNKTPEDSTASIDHFDLVGKHMYVVSFSGIKFYNINSLRNVLLLML